MKYRRVGLALLLAAALGACVFAPQALADSNARIVRLSYVDGQVQIDRRDGRGFEHAFLNMPLAPGTRVTTRDDGRAEIEFEDMSTVRLAPETLVETQSLDLRSSGGKYTLVDLQEGTAYFNIRKLEDDDDFRVVIGQREFSLTRASRFRLRVDRAQVVLAVFKGEVEITDQSGRLTVRKNETLTLDLDDPSRYYLAKSVDQDRYDDWDRERDEYRDRYANQGSYRGYSSAYSYGVADLNYWGNYTYISGYGYMWRPYYYGIGWNPYSNGGWYWYPGSGWIWVSAYPWGWMPFRYGSWHHVRGHGWCWRPGRHWNRWSPVVAVHNPPAGQVVPTPPPPTGRRDPVLVGSGPTTILPPEDPGPGRGRRDPDALGRRGGNPTGGSGSGVVGAPVAGSGGATSGGSGVTAGGGAAVSTGSGGSGRPAVDSRGGRGSGPVREVDLEDAIRNARERRLGGGQSGGVITNSGPGSSAPSSPSSGGSGSGAAAQDSSPASGRARVPESRRMLPESITRDSSTPASTSGSSGSATSGRSGGSGSGSGATSPSVERSPASRGGRSWEPRGEAPRGSYIQSSGPSRATSSSSAGPGSSQSSSGASAGSSVRSSYAPSSGSSGGRSSAGSSGSSSSGRSSGGASPSGAGRSSTGTGSSSSGARSSASATPK